MPFYDYGCTSCGSSTVRRGGYDQASIPCACGGSMRRAEFNCPELIGETVPKYGAKPGMPRDKHGRYRLDLFQEAHAEVMHHDPERKPFQESMQKARQMGAPIR